MKKCAFVANAAFRLLPKEQNRYGIFEGTSRVAASFRDFLFIILERSEGIVFTGDS